MHRLVNEILTAIEEKQYCTALFMDIEKAFDKVWHEGLLETTKTHFPRQIHNLIASYLSDRTFVVKINDTYSEIKDIKAGVPQGSVLGPVLYTLYTADIPTANKSKILTFADDTAVLATHPDPTVAVAILQDHVTKIEKWLAEKRIKTNPS
ncbi:hypothetical protein KPH14_013044, partial [Odynerus spinipes]